MSEPTRRFEDRLHELERTLAQLSDRLAALEGANMPHGPDAHAAVEPSPAHQYSISAASALSLFGRTCIVLGGAFLLRALTESGRLAGPAGIALGLTYAIVWIGAEDRAAARGQRPSAMFHGIVSMLIALPLVFEGATRFGVFSPAGSAGVLAALVTIALVVAVRQRLQSVAAIASLGTIATSITVAIATGEPIPSAVLLVALAAAALWIAYARAWIWLRWPTAVAADAMLFYLTMREAGPRPLGVAHAVIAFNVALAAIYFGAIAKRTLFGRESVLVFEVVQSLAVFGLLLASASTLAHGPLALALGCGVLTLGAAEYIVVLSSRERREAVTGRFYFHTTLAIGLAIGALCLLLDAPALTGGAAAAALVMAWLGYLWARPVLSMHGLAWFVVAAVASGWLAMTTDLWTGAMGTWPIVGALVWTVCLASGLGVAVPRVRHAGTDRAVVVAPRIAWMLCAAVSVATLMLRVVGPWVAGAPADAARLAMVRTTILAAGTLGAALASRIRMFEDAGLLVYVLLAIGALQMLADDLRVFRPMTLFVALAAYGIALVLAPRIKK